MSNQSYFFLSAGGPYEDKKFVQNWVLINKSIFNTGCYIIRLFADNVGLSKSIAQFLLIVPLDRNLDHHLYQDKGRHKKNYIV